MISMMNRKDVMNWLDNKGLTNAANVVAKIDYSLIPVGGNDSDDYIMSRSLMNLLPGIVMRSIECDVVTLTTDIDTIR
jgi:hypothetical protein